jgi:hypothetical protein
MPVRRAGPLPEAAQDEPSLGAAQGEPLREVARDGPPARAFFAPGHTSRRSPRSRRHLEKALQSKRRVEA